MDAQTMLVGALAVFAVGSVALAWKLGSLTLRKRGKEILAEAQSEIDAAAKTDGKEDDIKAAADMETAKERDAELRMFADLIDSMGPIAALKHMKALPGVSPAMLEMIDKVITAIAQQATGSKR
jgi:hypothetical protein